MSTTLKIVDDLGSIEAQIAALQAKQEDLKNQLKLLGAGCYAGKNFVTTVNAYDRNSVAWAKVAKELNAPKALVDKHTTTSVVMSATTEPLTA
jgi:hypothetical protein